MFKKIQIRIGGIHCESCKTLIETEVNALEGIKNIDIDWQSGDCRIEFDERKITQNEIFEKIEKLNYKVEEGAARKEPFRKQISKRFIIAGILLIAFIASYYLIRHFGLFEFLSRLNEQRIGYGLIFLIGILTGFHCVAMCGGFVVTYTVQHHAENQDKKTNHLFPHLQYNAGRIISYTLIGGILGGVGSFFGISPTFTGIIMLIAGGFMVLIGLSLLTHYKWLEKIKLRTPSFITRFLYGQRHTGKSKGPFIIGLLNGFMPCGPLQAMQLYALASGSIIRGALSLGIFAAGTVPLMFGFGSFLSLISRERIKQVMKLSGAVVMILGLFMISRGLGNFGYGFLGSNSSANKDQTENLSSSAQKDYQVVEMNYTTAGFSPSTLYVKKGIPVRWIINVQNVQQMTGCTSEILMPEYNIRKKMGQGENIIEFTPEKLGEIKFSCGMQMIWGKFVVTG